jgi:hypothetical protein
MARQSRLSDDFFSLLDVAAFINDDFINTVPTEGGRRP